MANRRFLLTTLALTALGGAWMVTAAMPQAPTLPPKLNLVDIVDTTRIVIEPAEAVAAGGRFRWNFEREWLESGESIPWQPRPAQRANDGSGRWLPAPGCRVYLKPLDDWDEGDERGHECRSPVVYRPAQGTVVIVIKPDELARGDARWAIDSMDAPWTRSGDQNKPVVGTYKLLFKGFDEGAWEAPENQEVTVKKNTTTRRTITFTRK